MRPADDAAAIALELVGPLAIIDAGEVVAQVDDQPQRAIGQTALFCLAGRVAFIGPEQGDES